MTKVLDLNYTDARLFFLKEESYFNFDLPHYFVFGNLLQLVSNQLNGQGISTFYSTTHQGGQTTRHFPAEYEDVNYKFLNNKDGKFAWRPFQLIHPALYVSLVNKITEQENWNAIISRFTQFQANPKIRCYSIPIRSDTDQSDKATSVGQWWQTIEQQSLELALKYEYVLHIDISDCYGSIYTHSIPWAIHTKTTAKAQRKNFQLVGNVIDKHLQDMSYGQTNGIPQGSVLMDFIAEMVLGFTDLELSDKIQQDNIQDYEIIRYRDDYRIFSNNPQTAEHITKLLTEILIELGMRLNAQKTIVSNNVIKNSLKSDKLYWISSKKGAKSIQEHLLIIHKLSEEHPNSGSLSKALSKFYNRIKGISETYQNITVLVSILVDIMFKNPRTYPIASAILSKLLSLILDNNKKNDLLNLIYQRFEKIPNTGHIKIWLQRLTIKLDRQRQYSEKLCEKVNVPALQIWNSDWLENNLKNIIEQTPIIDEAIIAGIDVVITSEEIELFKTEYDYSEQTAE
ncbi:RNA-directed DNA polymerase [Runella aurantiaca]|uniref:Reverse transcriptase n=1 Tax=Runella aurantiaca TaxID=2282308 RepID=A0A369I9H9_9BACT|nr:RNA-directed DNA polymerase [Runella aurantiaca]RDB03306.1 reverse transcriptase [Runella aurantiaca]